MNTIALTLESTEDHEEHPDAEEIGLSGELLGNFPQAFTQLAPISAAVDLDRGLQRSPMRVA